MHYYNLFHYFAERLAIMSNEQHTTPLQKAQVLMESMSAMEAYTSLPMVEYLRKTFGLSIGEILEAPKLLGTRFDKSAFNNREMQHSLRRFWLSQSGRCTTFAVKVAAALEKVHPSVFKFEMYDVGRHRLARCSRTGVVIDSSQTPGAFLMSEGALLSDGEGRHWKYSSGKSGFRNEKSSRVG